MNFSFCLHAHATFPQTGRGGFGWEAYVVCLDCGREFAYDWAAMRRGAEIKRDVTAVAGSGELAGAES